MGGGRDGRALTGISDVQIDAEEDGMGDEGGEGGGVAQEGGYKPVHFFVSEREK